MIYQNNSGQLSNYSFTTEILSNHSHYVKQRKRLQNVNPKNCHSRQNPKTLTKISEQNPRNVHFAYKNANTQKEMNGNGST